jgi:hypothetical protein
MPDSLLQIAQSSGARSVRSVMPLRRLFRVG